MCYVHCTELFQMIERTRQDQKEKVRERGKGDCLLCQVNIHRGKDCSSTFQTRAEICKNPCNGRADVSLLPSDGEAICLTARRHTVVRLYVVDTVDTLGKIEQILVFQRGKGFTCKINIVNNEIRVIKFFRREVSVVYRKRDFCLLIEYFESNVINISKIRVYQH